MRPTGSQLSVGVIFRNRRVIGSYGFGWPAFVGSVAAVTRRRENRGLFDGSYPGNAGPPAEDLEQVVVVVVVGLAVVVGRAVDGRSFGSEVSDFGGFFPGGHAAAGPPVAGGLVPGPRSLRPAVVWSWTPVTVTTCCTGRGRPVAARDLSSPSSAAAAAEPADRLV